MVNSLEKSSSPVALSGDVERQNIARLETMYEAPKKNGSAQRMTVMLENIIKMAQRTLSASAASILLFRDNDQELYFEVVSGPVSSALRQVKLNTQYGIAGQVARTGKPLIVNDVSRSVNFHKMIDDTTGFVTRSLICAPLMVEHKILGVIEILNKKNGGMFEEEDLDSLVSVATTAALAIDNTRYSQTMTEAYKSTVAALATTIDAKDRCACGHSLRVMEYTMIAGKYLALPPAEIETLEYASILHDVGKMSVDSGILNKAGPLTGAEWEMVKQHPAAGANLLQEIQLLKKAAEIILCHHERYDGKGYPNGQKGEEIPLGSRLIAVAEAFDNMTTDRSYRAAISVDAAVQVLHDCTGTQFCPFAVKAFVSGLHLSKKSR
jgi:response regulator RpfG family c-di-GMP phosphodiesterase